MTYRNRTDANQARIVEQLREIPGISVQILTKVKCGCPDLLIGYKERNYLVELKDGAKPPSARKLTDDESVWHSKWRGQSSVCCNLDEILAVVMAKKRTTLR